MKEILGALMFMMPFPLILVWALVTWGLWKIGKKFLSSSFANHPVRLVLVVVVATFWLGVSFWEAGGKKLYWDAKVRELCAIDGGVKVYESVELPSGSFDKYGQLNFWQPDRGEDALGPEYVFKVTTFYYLKGEQEIWRTHKQVIRRLDAKLLSESVRYSRRGGDLPGPWHPSSFSCPMRLGLVEKTFVQSNKE